jgi:FixJ family two-component response regulator
MIYIIDDDKSVRRSFELLLNSAGLETKSYAGANEFLDVYRQDEGDLLILDIHMPDMNGNELLKILKERKNNLPVITITAYDEDVSRRSAEEYGVLNYLVKPVDGETLIELISNHINNSSKVF